MRTPRAPPARSRCRIFSQVIENVEDDITMPHRVAIMSQVASGMEALAAHKLIHRDLALRSETPARGED